jgi:hypothetical protein
MFTATARRALPWMIALTPIACAMGGEINGEDGNAIEEGEGTTGELDPTTGAGTTVTTGTTVTSVGATTGAGGAPPDEGVCCIPGTTPGCADPQTEQCVCSQDDYCCVTAWDEQCVAEVDEFGCGVCGTGGLGGGDAGVGGGGQVGDACCVPQGGPGCPDPAVEACVCAIDDYCCITDWDDQCAGEVVEFGCGSC